MAYKKITSEDTNGKGVVGLPDTPQYDTTTMQKKFDELATDVIIPKFNQLVDDLGGDDAAGSTGAKVPDGLQADTNLQSILQALHDDTQTRQPKEEGKGLSENDYTDEEKDTVRLNMNARHNHENKSVLDEIVQMVKDGYDRLVTLFTGITSVSKTVEPTDESIPTGKAVVGYVQNMGGGDMSTSIYDPNKDGKVLNSEVSDNALKLGDKLPDYYASSDAVSDSYSASKTYSKSDIVINDNILYEAKQDIATPETFNLEHWKPTNLAAIAKAMQADISALNSNNKIVQYGEESMKSTSADVTVTKQITFQKSYTSIPVVFVAPLSKKPEDIYTCASDITTNGFTLVFKRKTTDSTGVNWLSIG